MDQAEEYVRELFSLNFSTPPGEDTIRFYATAVRNGILSAAGARLQVEELGRSSRSASSAGPDATGPPFEPGMFVTGAGVVPRIAASAHSPPRASQAESASPVPGQGTFSAPRDGREAPVGMGGGDVPMSSATAVGGSREWSGLFEHKGSKDDTRKVTSIVKDTDKDPEAVKEYVRELYRVYVGEITDVGKYGWIVKCIMDGSYTLNQAEMAIKFSPEARQRAQREYAKREMMQPQLQEYVKELYRVYLHRAATPEESKVCVDKVLAGTSLDALEDDFKLLAFAELPSVPPRS